MFKKTLLGAGLAISFLLSACQSTADEARALALQEELRNSSAIVKASIKVAIDKLKETVEEKPTLRPISDAAVAVSKKIMPLLDFIQELKAQLIAEAGGETNRKVPKQIFAKGGLGDSLKEKLSHTKAALFGIIDDIVIQSKMVDADGKPKIRCVKFEPKEIERLKEDLALEAADSISIADFFVAARSAEAIAILDKYEVDVWNAASQVVSFLSANMGCGGLRYDRYYAFSSSSKPYIILGETYESEIALGKRSSQEEFTVTVNGTPQRVEDGKASYKTRPSTTGTHSYTAVLHVIDPFSGKRDTVQKEFQYEVGMPMQSATADLMNIFYLGIENIIRIDAPSKNIAVSVSAGASLNDLGNGQYSVIPHHLTKRGEFVNIKISDKSTGRQIASYPFRVKALPQPKIAVNPKLSSLVKAGEIKAQPGPTAVLEIEDQRIFCTVESFSLCYKPRKETIQVTDNKGRYFEEKAKAMIMSAKPGDEYQFYNIYATCPGDAKPRLLNNTAFFVK